ncbi:MAG: hypothetical protein ACI9Y1_001657 [Lentisphaeria bacterium]|jgi:hypothetical protein
MLKKSFYSLLIFYGSNQADHYIEKIVVSHNRANLNIPEYMYDLWLDALILALRDYDEQFNSDVELAWRLVLRPGITHMKFKYSRIS